MISKKGMLFLFFLFVFTVASCGPRYYTPVYPVDDPYGRQFQQEVKNILGENARTEEVRARNDCRMGVYNPPSGQFYYLSSAYYHAWREEKLRIYREERRRYERWLRHQAIEDARRMYGYPPSP